jgi:hypothetical protein
MIISGTAGRHEAAVLTLDSSVRAETGNNVISPRLGHSAKIAPVGVMELLGTDSEK